MKNLANRSTLGLLLLSSIPLMGQDKTSSSTAVVLDKFTVEQKQDDPNGALPADTPASPFGISQSLRDIPRSISSISSGLLERYDVQTINDLVAIAPGTFTSSFYGIAGQIDVRGTPGETYFRGMKRIENPGNYPTPIGASDRIDILRGPPSPLYGPGKVGGYLNFEPKSARASTGRYFTSDKGEVKLTYGSWDKRIATAEVGGPGHLMDKRAGYYTYVQLEDSDSYYQNSYQKQFIVQTTFDIDLSRVFRVEFGEQYHHWEGTENAGWNRVTQDLIDNGNYMAGVANLNLDTNGDGFISPAEMTAAGGPTATWTYGTTPPTLGPQYALNPATVKTVKLDGSRVLVDSIDGGESDSACFFFDVVGDPREGLRLHSKFFLDYLDRNKHASYGFSQMQEALSLEQKFLVEHTFNLGAIRFENAYTAGFRYYDVQARSDSIFELGQRRDLSVGPTPNDRSLLSFFDPFSNPWGAEVQSTTTDVGFGVLSNITFMEKLHLLLGGRSDFFVFKSQNASGIRTSPGLYASANKQPIGYSGSLSYNLTKNLTPYVTYGHQPTPLIGQTGEVTVPSVAGRPLYDSELKEVGLKAELLDKKLFGSVAGYRQNRSSFDTRTNTIVATKSQGLEVELRYVPTRKLMVTGAATFQKTVFFPLSSRTVFTSPVFTGNNPALADGGTLRAVLPATIAFAERPGTPDRVFSLYGTYQFTPKFTGTLGAIYTAKVASGSSQLFILPASTVLNANLSYEMGRWGFKVSVNNLTDERYFRSLSPDSFGDFTVLPQLPINYQVSVGYKF